jgi:hypothetical protein
VEGGRRIFLKTFRASLFIDDLSNKPNFGRINLANSTFKFLTVPAFYFFNQFFFYEVIANQVPINRFFPLSVSQTQLPISKFSWCDFIIESSIGKFSN